MLALYLAALAFGLVLIGSSLLHGDGGDAGDAHDAHHDGHHHGGSHHGDAHGSDFLSLRFWTYALGAFGMTGTALHFLKTPLPLQVASAVVLGMGVGFGASRLFRGLARMGAGTLPDSKTLEGLDAEVVVALRPSGLGKVRVRVGDQDCELLARSGEETIERGGRVFVMRMNEGVAEVRSAPWKE
jgi:hypothetical protein